jgi:hypothetical protein
VTELQEIDIWPSVPMYNPLSSHKLVTQSLGARLSTLLPQPPEDSRKFYCIVALVEGVLGIVCVAIAVYDRQFVSDTTISVIDLT